MKYSKTVEGSVVHIDPINDLLEMEKGDKIKYDILICATGTVNHSSGDLPPGLKGKDAIRDYYKTTSEAIKHADRICIGVEVQLQLNLPEKFVQRSQLRRLPSFAPARIYFHHVWLNHLKNL